MKNNDHLLLKWETLKGWCFENSPEALQAFKDYVAIGMNMSAMFQHDTVEQKELICKMIDSINGEIQNDWSGEMYTKEQAKKYILEYRQK